MGKIRPYFTLFDPGVEIWELSKSIQSLIIIAPASKVFQISDILLHLETTARYLRLVCKVEEKNYYFFTPFKFREGVGKISE